MFVIHYIKDILLQIYIKIAIYRLVGIKKSAFSLELSLFSGCNNNAPSINEQHLLILLLLGKEICHFCPIILPKNDQSKSSK